MNSGLRQAIDLAVDALNPRKSRNTDRGRELTTVCPFHNDRSPSFGLNLDTGQWNCFAGCGGGWIDTLLYRLGFDRSEVIPLLRDAVRPTKMAKRNIWAPPKEPSRILPEEVLGLFEHCPMSMLEDGWPEELLWTFEIGYDMGKGRITFPIRDIRGRLAGISGRTAYGWVEPKYLIYRRDDDLERDHLYEMAPKDYVPNRAGMLHNAHRALSLAPGDPLVIVEGFKEVMKLHQAGICGVGLMGSMLTWAQYQTLNHIYHATKAQFVVVMDNDRAGHSALPKICQRLLGCTMPKVNFTTDVKDLGELQDLDMVVAVINEAENYNRYIHEHRAGEHG